MMEISPEHNVIHCQRTAVRLPAFDLMLHGGVDVRKGEEKKKSCRFSSAAAVTASSPAVGLGSGPHD